MKSLTIACVLSVVAFLFVSGCGTSPFPVKPVKGQVVCDGKPMSSGSISFTPIGAPGKLETGKPASAAIGPDGSFVLSTYGRFDGAIVGKHRVQYDGSEVEDSEEDSSSESSTEEGTGNESNQRSKKLGESQCVQKGEIIVEVVASGQNNFTIELNSKLR